MVPLLHQNAERFNERKNHSNAECLNDGNNPGAQTELFPITTLSVYPFYLPLRYQNAERLDKTLTGLESFFHLNDGNNPGAQTELFPITTLSVYPFYLPLRYQNAERLDKTLTGLESFFHSWQTYQD